MYLYKLLLPAFQNSLMQQPLAHLYFLTILEQLLKKEHTANFLIRIASRLDEVRTQIFVESMLITQCMYELTIFYSDVTVTKLQTLQKCCSSLKNKQLFKFSASS